ncbi:hypothetical protein A2V49_03330 [candidate division WWE3 bacterium RBG_19FT_COMBO_34_6]|uniref:Methenyltetrahydrofolate cyclohydrolase n=1 Tax=candidate division WWE3 bacterium RBG_19FT_COMBO_34_6 TaxID=1802612 RepID=A0A1F4UML1_UNCKA|nr:MAG: hypothetical protein A2V49_03330 [candidate division WWE3 bacterium RBG_19FT_COMBO_34_6]
MINFDGKKEAENLDLIFIDRIKQFSLPKTLLILQIGDNLSSEKYINLKIKYCEKIGVGTIYKKIEPILSDGQIMDTVKNMLEDENIDGAIIQIPLPRQSLQNILNLIPYNKDLDLLSDKKREQFYQKNFNFLPPTVRALRHFLALDKINMAQRSITILGGGDLVGKPVAFYLSSLGAKVTVLDTEEITQTNFKNLSQITLQSIYHKGQKIDSNLVISAMGKSYYLDPDDLKPGTSIVDFGSSIVNGATIGDLDTRDDISHLGYVSLSPGGMGPLVIRYLIANLIGL